jgi:hypothetical protein
MKNASKSTVQWSDFGWQGIRLKVPENWNLGKIDGDYKSGYARLDDDQIVRAEVEWRDTRGGRHAGNVTELVDRYLANLEKKAAKTDMPFEVHRRAKFLKDKRWLAGYDYETFIWEADYRAFNLARVCGECGRVILLRLLTRLDEAPEPWIDQVFQSLEDHPQDGQIAWSIYGLRFSMPEQYKLKEYQLKSGHIQLSMEEGRHICQVHRISLAHILLKNTTLTDWYSGFFKKQLRDFNYEVFEEEIGGHPGLRIEGRPRSRLRQLLRPLPFLNPRPRQYLDARVWHWEAGNKICIVDHLYRKKGEKDDLTQRISDGYILYQEAAETQPRGNAQLAAGTQ